MNNTEKTRSLLIADEDGSVSFISLVIVLGMAVLIGFVGNMANETIERQKLQNAADATAYSSAVWLARGMNTVSTVNHVMGELTSIIVIIEALGGPEAEGDDFSSDKEGTIESGFNAAITFIRVTAAEHMNLVSDSARVNQFVRLMVDSHKMHQCGAAIYDAEVNLKMHAMLCLMGKVIGNILEDLQWVPIAGPALLAAGKLLHFCMNIYMKVIEIETRCVRGLEKILPMVARIKGPLRTLISAMEKLGHGVPDTFHAEQSGFALPCVLLKNAAYFKNHYGLESVSYAAYGLPVVAEPWELQQDVKNPYDAHPWLGDGVFPGFADSVAASAGKALSAISVIDLDWFSKKKRRMRNKINDALDEFNGKSRGRGSLGWGGNPSIGSLTDLNADYERHTQWVRATNPYVDMYREPFRNCFAPLMLSQLKTFFTAWTYRYTLNESHNLHADKLRMLVMIGTEYDIRDGNKGNESWTDSAVEAERYFSVIVAAEAPPQPSVFSPHYFVKARTKGAVAISQAMFYNLNGRTVPTQQSASKMTSLQPNTGWDTLQWNPGKPLEDNGKIVAREWESCDPLGGGFSGAFNTLMNLISGAQSKTDKELIEISSDDDENNLETGIGGMLPSSGIAKLFVMQAPPRTSVHLNWQAKLRPVDLNSVSELDKLLSTNGNVSRHCNLMLGRDNPGSDFLTH